MLSVTFWLLAGCQSAPLDDRDGQIVGGRSVDISEYPWQASFRRYGSHICGGSVISPSWILTAAHCVEAASNPRIVTVRVGSSSQSGGGQVLQAQSVAAHPAYDAATLDNDVGLVRLQVAVELGDNVKVVSLVAAGTDPAAGETLSVSGWGLLSAGGWNTPDTLQAVDVPAVPRAACSAAYGARGYSILNSMICAGVGGKDSCQGDSGGPIVNGGGKQVGVVSWGIGCALAGFPGVYSNVADTRVRSWIRSQAGVQ